MKTAAEWASSIIQAAMDEARAEALVDVRQIRRGQESLVSQAVAFASAPALKAELKYYEFGNGIPKHRIAELVRRFENGVPFDKPKEG